MVIFVIGANYTGKSYFISRTFSGGQYALLNVYDYQKRLAEERRRRQGRYASFPELYQETHQANRLLKEDIVALVRQGRDVVAEQTFFRALRRIPYLDAIRAVSDTPVEVYVMQPTEEELLRNCRQRNPDSAEGACRSILREIRDIFEFPNPAEGFSRIFTVTEGRVAERLDPPDFEAVERAREELRWEQRE
ncbi:MAG: ATP-binding protein [Oscillibacter sp.]|nr:ATP-binding protein [Oscillibacter sp.]